MKKKYLAILLVILLTAAFSGCTAKPDEGVTGEQETSQKPGIFNQTKPVAKPASPAQINFSKRGTILNWDSRTESYVDEWTFLWDEPGALALTVKLIFDKNSICNMGKKDEVCDKNKLNNGETVNIEGFEDGGKLTVTKLNYSTDNSFTHQ